MHSKYLLLSEIFPPQHGGSGRWFSEVYKRLPPEQVVLAVGKHPSQEVHDAQTKMEIHRLPLRRREWGILSGAGLLGHWRTLMAIRKIIRQSGVTQVHCGRCLPEGVAAWGLRMLGGPPYCCYIHGEDVNTALESREHTWLVKRVLAGASYLIANSQNSRQMLLNEWEMPAEKVVVLHPGVDSDVFCPGNVGESRRQRWSGRTVLLTVGRLQKRKGHDMAIQALPEIRRRVPEVLYVIVGSGDEKQRLEGLATEYGVADCVEFLGEIDDGDLVSIYRQSTLFLLPNRQVGRDIEGFGIVLVEAQACGTPVIAGNSGGTAETIVPGETGLLVDANGAEDLAAAVLALLDDPARRERMGRAGRAWVVEQFSWPNLAQKALKLFYQSSASR